MTVAASTRPHDPAGGFTSAEARRRLAQSEPPPQTASRSYASIVRANVFTIFNLILLVAGIATLAFGEWQDALFLGVLVANSAIGITQEIRAKRALDRLESLVAPTAKVVRDGEATHWRWKTSSPATSSASQPGDQVVADGRLVEAGGARARRVDPDRRVAPGPARSGRRDPLRLVRASKAQAPTR